MQNRNQRFLPPVDKDKPISGGFFADAHPFEHMSDPLFRQRSAEDALPNDPLGVDEERYGEALHAVGLGHLQVGVEENREGHLPMVCENGVVGVFAEVHCQNHKALRLVSLVGGLYFRHLLFTRLHAVYQVAQNQKLNSTTFPRSSDRVMARPSNDFSVKSGAGPPTCGGHPHRQAANFLRG